jgi:hypothetical protein
MPLNITNEIPYNYVNNNNNKWYIPKSLKLPPVGYKIDLLSEQSSIGMCFILLLLF